MNTFRLQRKPFKDRQDQVLIHPDNANSMLQDGMLVQLNEERIFLLSYDTRVRNEYIYLDEQQYSATSLCENDVVLLDPYVAKPMDSLKTLTLLVSGISSVDLVVLEAQMRKHFIGHYVYENQTMHLESPLGNLVCRIESTLPNKHGIWQTTTVLNVEPGEKSTEIQGLLPSRKFFTENFDFEHLGIGGLGSQCEKIFRRAFTSRMYRPSVIEAMNLQHLRGMIFYGPPGCGKTLLARKLCEILHTRPPKICNGPEILNRYVGGSEENIRSLFKDAEEEQAQKGMASMLHVIIFDELDAICKRRGSLDDNTGTMDSIVNQLLSKIDGIESLQNILLIGLTNRLDLIDEALLRPGRMELHVEIGLPSADGRKEILEIHCAFLRKTQSEFVDKIIPWLVDQTKNFSGAELEGVVRCATSYALERNLEQPGSVELNEEDVRAALKELQPQWTTNKKSLERHVPHGIIIFDDSVKKVQETLISSIKTLQSSSTISTFKAVLEGESGCGMTAMAVYTALNSTFSHVQVVSLQTVIGKTEHEQCQHLINLFQKARRFRHSFLILDDLDRLVQYTAISKTFSIPLVNTLMSLLREHHVDGDYNHVVFATTSQVECLCNTGLISCFDVQVRMPPVETMAALTKILDDIPTHVTLPIPVKKAFSIFFG